MLQRRRGPDLGDEPLGAEHCGELRLQDFDGDLALVFDIVREIDRRHPARTQLALDAIAIGHRTSDLFECVHRRTERERAKGPAEVCAPWKVQNIVGAGTRTQTAALSS